MSSISHESVRKCNERCGNGFELDVMYYLTWGRKQLVKDVIIDDDTKLRFELSYQERSDTLYPTLYIEIEKKSPTSEYFWMHSSGNYEDRYMFVDMPQSKRNLSILQKISCKLSESFINGCIEKYEQCEDPFFETDIFETMKLYKTKSIMLDEISA